VIPPAQITVSAVFDRMRVHPWGLNGGQDAMNSAILIKKKGDTVFRTFTEVHGAISPAIFMNCVISGNDQVLLRSPGGGGYGPPEQREPEAVLRDVQQGFVSPQAAREFYKVAVHNNQANGARTAMTSDCQIDWETTHTLRGA